MWNARTLYRPGALQEMKEEMVKYKTDILAIQETRWPSEGILCQRDTTFYYTKSKQGMYGVAFIVNKRTQDAIIDFKPINECICIIRYKTKFYKVALVNVHGPTEDKDELEKEDFCHKLDNVIDKIPNHDMKIILGDFNMKIGKEEKYIPTIGKHSIDDRSNDNGMQVIDLAVTYNFVVCSTQFPHKRIHKITWQSPDGDTENQIDHILIDSRQTSTITGIRIYRGANINSDHYLVRIKTKQRISGSYNRSVGKSNAYDVDKLKDENIKAGFLSALREKLKSNLPDINITTQDDWKTVEELICQEAQIHLGTCPKIQRKEWFNEECRISIQEKNKAREKVLQHKTRSNTEYKRKHTKAFKLIRRKEPCKKDQLQQLEQSHNNKQIREFYKIVNNVKGFKTNTTMIRNTEGEIISGKQEVLNRWKEYFTELLNEDTEENTGM